MILWIYLFVFRIDFPTKVCIGVFADQMIERINSGAQKYSSSLVNYDFERYQGANQLFWYGELSQ